METGLLINCDGEGMLYQLINLSNIIVPQIFFLGVTSHPPSAEIQTVSNHFNFILHLCPQLDSF